MLNLPSALKSGQPNSNTRAYGFGIEKRVFVKVTSGLGSGTSYFTLISGKVSGQWICSETMDHRGLILRVDVGQPR